MKIYSVLQIGQSHLNQCEDYLMYEQITQNKMIFAVMDGCTMGTESHFASTLTGRLLRKISKEFFYKDFINKREQVQESDEILKLVLKKLFEELKIAKNFLQLEKTEMLNTMLLLICDLYGNEGVAIAIGDGLVCVDGEITDFDQKNIPDYLGYHISEDFDYWYRSQTQIVRFEKFKDVGISTDGIFTFLNKENNPSSIDPVDFLLKNKEHIENEKMLALKISQLEKMYGLTPLDDIGIIRIIF
jgi:hypothetical protein